MKVFFWLGLVLLCIGIIIFGLENRQEVDIRLFGTVFPGVKVMYVAFLSVLVGVAFTAIIAIAEGARIRLGNRRLRREISRLESELHHIRAQSAQAATPPRSVEANSESTPSRSLAPTTTTTTGAGAGTQSQSSQPNPS